MTWGTRFGGGLAYPASLVPVWEAFYRPSVSRDSLPRHDRWGMHRVCQTQIMRATIIDEETQTVYFQLITWRQLCRAGVEGGSKIMRVGLGCGIPLQVAGQFQPGDSAVGAAMRKE